MAYSHLRTTRLFMQPDFIRMGLHSLSHKSVQRTVSTQSMPSRNIGELLDDRCILPCPYEAGAHMKLSYLPEGSNDVLPLEATVIKPFEPFSISQCLLARSTSQLPGTPTEFLVKLVDPRFSEPSSFPDMGLNRTGWTQTCDATFKAGLRKTRHGVWDTYWRELGASKDVLSYDRGLPSRPHSESEISRKDFVDEIDAWINSRFALTVEVEAYRRLRKLQGHGIPRLYGTCSYTVSDGSSNLDPFIAQVPGIVIEHIKGASLDKLSMGKDFSEDEAERIAQGALKVIRNIRDSLVLHHDLAARNIVVRQDDLDHPVIIDFGSALLIQDVDCRIMDLDKWIDNVGHGQEPDRVRRLFAELNMHNPSPVPELMHEVTHGDWIPELGYSGANWCVERIRPGWREKNYERISDVPLDVVKTGPNGEKYTWEHLRWRIRSDAKTANASADYIWGRKEYGRVPPWSWS